MKFALNISDENRILSATFEKYASADAVLVDILPDGNIADYLYINNEYIYDPIPVVEVIPEPTPQDDVDAMLVDHEYRLTMLELGIVE